MSPYIAEIIGTMILIYLGNGVVANVTLNKTKGNNSGLIVVALGWASAVIIPALMFTSASGAHFNPALTLGLATIGGLPWRLVPGYIICQMIGAIIGGCLVYIHYKDHFDITPDQDSKLAAFATIPAIRNLKQNFISEFLATFLLLFTILGIAQTTEGDPETLGVMGVGVIILAIGLSLGGTTGYAINPARDLGPRIAYTLLPIKNKRDADWGYALIPSIAPICGAVLAALLSIIIFT